MSKLTEERIKAIREIVDSSITNFAVGFESRYKGDVHNEKGVINQKKNNVFIKELGKEFMFYSALMRSFDSSFGNVLENMGKSIAKLLFEVRGTIDSYILPQQTQHIDYLLSSYDNKAKPEVNDYDNFNPVQPGNIESYLKKQNTDNYFYDRDTKTHYIIELKAGGDLDLRKARSEKDGLLKEYFLLKNKIKNTDEKVEIKFATAYNKYGEDNTWKQHSVKKFFAEDELVIGKDYWNFVCGDSKGFEIVFDQYKKSSVKIKEALERIKELYFE